VASKITHLTGTGSQVFPGVSITPIAQSPRSHSWVVEQAFLCFRPCQCAQSSHRCYQVCHHKRMVGREERNFQDRGFEAMDLLVEQVKSQLHKPAQEDCEGNQVHDRRGSSECSMTPSWTTLAQGRVGHLCDSRLDRENPIFHVKASAGWEQSALSKAR